MNTLHLHTLVPLVIAALSLHAHADESAPVVPLPQAHAHNDYEHARPLLDALGHGFCSVEADIWLRDGQLLIGHDVASLQPDRTLETLYLAPLKKRIADQGGRVYRDGPRFWLLVDIKTDPEPTYLALHDVLARYADLITTVSDGKSDEKALTIVISGFRPRELMARQTVRYAAFDGRLDDLESNESVHFMPMISDRWDKHFTWSGTGPMPADQRTKLHSIVQQAHERGRVVRLWATPERPEMWKELLAAKVDVINTDRLAELQDFLTSAEK